MMKNKLGQYRCWMGGYVLLWLLVGVGCGQKHVSEAELQTYVQNPDNGLIQVKNQGNLQIKASVKPTELLVLQELRTLPQPTALQQDSLRTLYADKLYFLLSMQKDGKEIETQFLYDRVLYQQAVQYLTGRMEHDLKLVTDRDTVSPIGFVYPRMYRETGQSTIMVVFDRTKFTQPSELYLIWNDPQFGTGNHRFTFRMKDIERVPLSELCIY